MELLNECRLLFTSVTVPPLLNGLLLSFKLAGGILLASLVAGTILALLKTYAGKIIGAVVTIYVEIFRNTPILFWITVCFPWVTSISGLQQDFSLLLPLRSVRS